MAKYGKLGNIGCYKGKGKHGLLCGIHQWFGSGHNARIKANYLIWYPAILDQWCTYIRLYMEISAWEIADKIWWASKVTSYVHHLSCGTGNWLRGSEIDPS
eukprot:1253226-Ditylum_brightwellii.AAC.1